MAQVFNTNPALAPQLQPAGVTVGNPEAQSMAAKNAQCWLNIQIRVKLANGTDKWTTVRGIPLDAEVSKSQFYAKDVEATYFAIADQMMQTMEEGQEITVADNGLFRINLFRKSNQTQPALNMETSALIMNMFGK